MATKIKFVILIVFIDKIVCWKETKSGVDDAKKAFVGRWSAARFVVQNQASGIQ